MISLCCYIIRVSKKCLAGGIRFFRYANIAIPGFGATRRSVSLSFFAFQSGNNPRFRAIRRTRGRYDLLSMAVVPIGSRTASLLDMAPDMVPRWISKRVSAMLELSGTTTFQDFDGYGRPNRLGDHMVSLTAGFTFHLGKVGWKRAVDATSYIRQNEWLVDHANILSGENKRYKDWYDRNRRTVAELKKILEIEGLLDKYGHLVNDDETDRRQGYPRNNYSGLNSLRARLKNRHWDGISPLDSASIGYGNNGDDAEKPGIIVSERTELIQAGNCIGSPVYFFFNLNTAHLTDASQMLNLDELARVAKKYGLSLRVTGAADSSTGTPVLNGSLSTSRADYIVAELKKRGIPIERIVKVSRGGIADHVPVEVNRHTKVELFF